MANKEHLKVLAQGTDAWNEWREQYPEIYPELSGADLSQANLSEANLSEAELLVANLSQADLSGADLRNAFLAGANLSDADLSGADLRNAFLAEANLSDADLSEATISKADLHDANLSGADLSGADLSGADLRKACLRNAFLVGANLSDADLSEATLSKADLTRADLSEATLSKADLTRATLSEATLTKADLTRATLTKATLSKAYLIEAYLYRATLSDADLIDANLRLANLIDAILSRADLSRADLSFATLVRTNLKGTTLTECRIYGISAWDIELTEATQNSLVITPPDQPTITVDNLKIAQFIYLLLNNQEIRAVINTITTKVVLILGRFTAERKTVLDALRNSLRTKDYVPIMFDFDKPASKDTQETITTLARLARFVIADITEAKSIPQELVSIVEALPSLAIQPLLQRDSEPWGMYDHIKRYPWVLPIHRYLDLADLFATLEERVINPAERKAQELTRPS